MLKLFKKFARNKIFYVFIFFIILLLPSSIYLQDENSRRDIITAVGLDLLENGVEVSVLRLARKEESINGVGLNVVSAKGQTITEALYNMSLNTGKAFGFSHCEAIVLSDSVVEDHVLKYLDYFMRSRTLTSSVELVNTKNAKELLTTILQSKKLSTLSIKEIVHYNSGLLVSKHTNLDSFYRSLYSETPIALITRLQVVSEEEAKAGADDVDSGFVFDSAPSDESSGDSGGGSGSNQSSNSESGSEGGSGGGESGGGKSKLVDDGSVIILKNGKKVGELKMDEFTILNIISPQVKSVLIKVENVTDEGVENATVTIETVEKKVITTTRIVNGRPLIYYHMIFVIQIQELISNRYSIITLDDLICHISPEVEDAFLKKIRYDFSSLVNRCKEEGWDLFNVYRRFFAHQPEEWEKYLNSLEDRTDYMEDVLFCMDIDYLIRI